MVTWTEEQLLEMAASLPAMRTIRHQPWGLSKRRVPFSGSCFRIARIATTNGTSDAILSPSRLSLVQAYDFSEHAYDEALTPGQRRKLGLELAGKRAMLAVTGAWMELLRVYVGDFLSHEVDARTSPAGHYTESGHDTCFGQDGLVQHQGRFADTADQHVRTRRTRKQQQDTLACGR